MRLGINSVRSSRGAYNSYITISQRRSRTLFPYSKNLRADRGPYLCVCNYTKSRFYFGIWICSCCRYLNTTNVHIWFRYRDIKQHTTSIKSDTIKITNLSSGAVIEAIYRGIGKSIRNLVYNFLCFRHS